MPSYFCDDPAEDPKIDGKLAIVSRGNCTFLEKANHTQLYGGKALVIVSKEGLVSVFKCLYFISAHRFSAHSWRRQR
jgi:hypothetical protein